ncbi:hypothetical protein ACLOJK_001729 [Asimina triloba]
MLYTDTTSNESLTQFKCGGLVLACRSNHCLFDGIASHEFQANLAALTRSEGLIINPNPDRMIFRARNPPKISYPHLEYSEITHLSSIFSGQGMPSQKIKQPQLGTTCLIHLSPERMVRMKAEAVKDGPLVNCTAFHILAAKIWKARAIAISLPDDRISTLLFPVDVRKRVTPHAPPGFSGNALVPGFARASAHELKTCQQSVLVKKVHEGLQRLDDEYVRSGIDWLETHKGVPCMVDSFSVVAWWKLGLETACFGWGQVKCLTPVEVAPELVFLLPGEKDEGGIHVCLQLPSEQMKEFYKLIMED